MAFLCEPDSSPTPLELRLHKVALKKLTSFGPQYPVDFRSVMQNRPDLRSRVECAVHWQNEQEAATAAKLAASDEPRPTHAAPASIKLKMDFSNFTS